MPRIRGFTEEQKRESEISRRKEEIRRGLFGYKGVNGLTCETLGRELGISHNTLAKYLRGEAVALRPEQWLRIISLAGLSVRKGEEK